MKQTDLRDMFKEGILHRLWYLLTTCLLLHQILQLRQLQKTQKRALIIMNQQMNEISTNNTPLNTCAAQL